MAETYTKAEKIAHYKAKLAQAKDHGNTRGANWFKGRLNTLQGKKAKTAKRGKKGYRKGKKGKKRSSKSNPRKGWSTRFY